MSETNNKLEQLIEKLAVLSQERIDKLVSVLDNDFVTTNKTSDDGEDDPLKPIQVAESDMVEQKVKTKKGRKKAGTPIHNLTGLQPTTIITAKPDAKEAARNAKRVSTTKQYRPTVQSFTCDSPNCKGGPNNKAFVGPDGCFSVFRGQRLCSRCLQYSLGS